MIIKLDYREKKLNGQLLKLKDKNKFDEICVEACQREILLTSLLSDRIARTWGVC